MKYRLGLSAEGITDRISPLFEGVGMLRGEYLCRKINKYVTLPECRNYMRDYIGRMAKLFAPLPLWYRTTEMEVAEVNVLDGVDRIIEENNTMMGYRGIRRATLIKETFLTEVSVIAELAEQHPNLHILIPFIHDPSELLFVKDCLSKVGFKNLLGIMAEIPSTILCLEEFLAIGVDNVTIGMNDLSSLTLGAYRGSGLTSFLHPAVKKLLVHAREITRVWNVPISVAGYMKPDFLEYIESLNYDYAVLHYSKLDELLGDEFSNLPHKENLQQIKLKTRELIKQRNERIVIENWKRHEKVRK